MPSLPIPTNSSRQNHPVLDKCAFLARSQVWPHINTINPRQWIKNFKGADELLVAHELLNSFMYFSPLMARELLRSAVQKIIPHLVDFTSTHETVTSTWQDTIQNLVVVSVSGEVPNPTDSGLGYVRMVRDMFGLPQARFISLRQLVSDLMAPPSGPRPTVLFVDDVVGTGQQFATLWETPLPFSFDLAVAPKEVAQSGAKFFYCPLVATAYGLKYIDEKCHGDVTVCPAYILTDDYNALAPNSRIWTTPEAKAIAPTVLASIASRVGMPDTDGSNVNDWRGYHKLGLGLAIRDSIPDACLGVFHFNENNWKPLFNKAG
jgi:hypothetical protein